MIFLVAPAPACGGGKEEGLASATMRFFLSYRAGASLEPFADARDRPWPPDFDPAAGGGEALARVRWRDFCDFPRPRALCIPVSILLKGGPR